MDILLRVSSLHHKKKEGRLKYEPHQVSSSTHTAHQIWAPKLALHYCLAAFHWGSWFEWRWLLYQSETWPTHVLVDSSARSYDKARSTIYAMMGPWRLCLCHVCAVRATRYSVFPILVCQVRAASWKWHYPTLNPLVGIPRYTSSLTSTICILRPSSISPPTQPQSYIS